MAQSTEDLSYVGTTKKQLWHLLKEIEAQISSANERVTTIDWSSQSWC